jgi:hypothetical protein
LLKIEIIILIPKQPRNIFEKYKECAKNFLREKLRDLTKFPSLGFKPQAS